MKKFLKTVISMSIILTTVATLTACQKTDKSQSEKNANASNFVSDFAEIADDESILDTANSNAKRVYAAVQDTMLDLETVGGSFTGVLNSDNSFTENLISSENSFMPCGEFTDESIIVSKINEKIDIKSGQHWQAKVGPNQVEAAILWEDEEYIGGYPKPQNYDTWKNNNIRWIIADIDKAKAD
ncbi:MAG: hypothetical protein LBL93_03155 [Ruminococcus sp.]|jgi:hypothetical protein|nr:hypothetical protein [Ruminococcus sp.]